MAEKEREPRLGAEAPLSGRDRSILPPIPVLGDVHMSQPKPDGARSVDELVAELMLSADERRALFGNEAGPSYQSPYKPPTESLAELEGAVVKAMFAESPQAQAAQRAEDEASKSRLRRASLARRIRLAQFQTTNRRS